MIANISNLSQALEQAAPDRKLAGLIRSDKSKIASDIEREGFSIVRLNGQKFRVVAKKGMANVDE